MEDPNDVLRAEHEDIQKVLSVLEGMARRMRGMANVPVADLDNTIVILEDYADHCHHTKEEQVLFPELARASPEVGAELARRLKGDHRALRKLVGTMKGLVPRAGSDGVARGCSRR
jgi:hemerythrin-like domain-containing protein